MEGRVAMLKEFKAFAMRGNVVDMAVGIIIGVAFGRIVTSLVNDVLMPPIGLILGKVDFSSLFVNLSGTAYPSLVEARKAGASVLAYGAFLNTILDFIIVAFVIFLLIKQMNRLQKPAPAAVLSTKECPQCLSTIPIKATRCAFCTSQLAPS
jgi:large conductance mechanosensitive channel